jgi:ssDNA-binding Zn-finger/Zn-ribbon topoisomerase 1
MSRVTKGCPRCGGVLVIRVNGLTGEDFLGCRRWPECKHTEPLAPDLALRIQGAATLPGLDEVAS